MNVLKGILSEGKQYYLDVKQKIEGKLSSLPKGSVKERKIAGQRYYYLQQRIGKKIVHKYLGKQKPDSIIKQIKEREILKLELKKANGALRIIRKSEGKKHG
jgi:hypothetical protein